MKFIILQSNYNEIELGIQNKDRFYSKKINKFEATSNLIPEIDNLLKQNNLNLSDLDFIAANQGPAPFTTLRVILATINGFNLAKKIPLIGIDGLHAFLSEIEKKHKNKNILILLNAFGGDIYFGLKNNQEKKFGYLKLDQFLKENKKLDNLVIAGNALQKYSNEIQTIFPQAKIENIDYVNLESIKNIALSKFLDKEVVDNLQPLYLKSTDSYKTK